MFKFLFIAFAFSTSNPYYEKAKVAYDRGLSTKSSLEKNAEWNQSVYMLLQDPEKNSATLASLAALLANFQEYAFASYYLRQAIRQDPTNEELYTQLNEIIRLGNLPQDSLKKPSYFNNRWAFLLSFFLTFILAGLWIRWPHQQALRLAIYLSMIPLVLFGVLFFIQVYLEPIEGVLIQSNYLYQGPSRSFAPVSSEPMKEGLLVEVLDVSTDQKFLKIQTKEELVGFISEKAIRVLH